MQINSLRDRALLFASAALTLAGVVSCPSDARAAHHGQTQTEMNLRADQKLKIADVKLNAAYKRLFARVDATSQEKLKVTQRAWIAYRDAQADLHADMMARGGTMEPMDRSATATALTQTRTRELEAMLRDVSSR